MRPVRGGFTQPSPSKYCVCTETVLQNMYTYVYIYMRNKNTDIHKYRLGSIEQGQAHGREAACLLQDAQLRPGEILSRAGGFPRAEVAKPCHGVGPRLRQLFSFCRRTRVKGALTPGHVGAPFLWVSLLRRQIEVSGRVYLSYLISQTSTM